MRRPQSTPCRQRGCPTTLGKKTCGCCGTWDSQQHYSHLTRRAGTWDPRGFRTPAARCHAPSTCLSWVCIPYALNALRVTVQIRSINLLSKASSALTQVICRNLERRGEVCYELLLNGGLFRLVWREMLRSSWARYSATTVCFMRHTTGAAEIVESSAGKSLLRSCQCGAWALKMLFRLAQIWHQ